MSVLDTQIDVRTARLRLRSLQDRDADRIHALFGNWEVIRWLDEPPWPYEREHADWFVNARKVVDSDFITTAITRDDLLIGIIGATLKQPGGIHPKSGYSIGYWIGQPYWGRGYMSEAARGFIAHLFATVSDDTIYSGAFTDNAASLRIQDKLGFTRDGEMMCFSNPHRKEMPHIRTSLTRARFMARTG